MDALKKARKVHRGQFTKSVNNFKSHFSETLINRDEVRMAFRILERKFKELERNNNQLIELMMADSTAAETDIEKEIESHDEYNPVDNSQRLGNSAPPSMPGQPNNITTAFKRPTLDIPIFNGDISGWITFWSHFLKYHEDKTLNNEDKLTFLKMAMAKESKAANIRMQLPYFGREL